MPTAPIAGIPIRLQVSTASAPPVPPIDVNTGLPPAQWRANTVSYQAGVFDVNGDGVDLSNLAYLQLTIAENQNSPANLITSIVLAAGIIPTITQSAWLAGTAQNASFDLSAAATDVSLSAQPSQNYWIQLSGVTTLGARIVYGAGYVTFYNSGSATPAPISGITSRHDQTNASGDGSIDPTTNIHTEVITVAGSAGTRNFVLTPGSTSSGAWVYVGLIMPTTPGITINILQGDLSGATLATITTDGFITKGFIGLSFDATDYALLESSFS